MNKKMAPGGRVERRMEETKQKIIDMAMTLFKENGVDNTTMEQIAAEVDIAKGTLYNYFPVKEAIIDEAFKRFFQNNNSDIKSLLQKMPDTRSRCRHVFNLLVQGVQQNKEIFAKYMVYRMRIMVSFEPADSDKSGFYLLGTEIVRLGQEDGEIRDDLPMNVLRELFEFAFIEAVKQFYMEPAKFDVGEIIERYVDLCLNGIRRQAK